MRLLILFIALGVWLGTPAPASADYAPRPASFRALARYHVQAMAEQQGVPLRLLSISPPTKAYFRLPDGLAPCWRIIVTYRGPEQTQRHHLLIIGERVLGFGAAP